MKIGIVSDTHGQFRHLQIAIKLLDAAGADAYIHCGDVGGLNTLDELAGRRCWFIWGNMDRPQPTWRQYVEEIGLHWPNGPLELTLDNRRIAVFHGHEQAFHLAIQEADHDYIFHGHTHQPAHYRVGSLRIINPGALQRAKIKTAALLDLKTDHLQFIQIPQGHPYHLE